MLLHFRCVYFPFIPPPPRTAKPKKYSPPATRNARNLDLYAVTIPNPTHASADTRVCPRERHPHAPTSPALRPEHRPRHYLPPPPSHRFSALSAHVLCKTFESAANTPPNNRHRPWPPGHPRHPAPPSLHRPIWDNPHKGSSLPRPKLAACAPNNIMLNELEFAYTPVRDKVRDLREYL